MVAALLCVFEVSANKIKFERLVEKHLDFTNLYKTDEVIGIANDILRPSNIKICSNWQTAVINMAIQRMSENKVYLLDVSSCFDIHLQK